MRVINDLHLGSSYELMNYGRCLDLFNSSVPTVWLGDIVDLKNCRKEEVPMWETRLRKLYDMAKAKDHLWIRGNHELNFLPDSDWAVRGEVFYTHGDIGYLWSEAKGMAYRNKKPGAGWLKRTFFSPLLEEARDVWGAHIHKEFLLAVSDLKHLHPSVKLAVFGHSHPRKPLTGESGGVKYIVLPRGVNEVVL